MPNTIITDERIKAIVKETVRETVHESVRETLLSMGFNIADPDEIIAHQKDKAYLRSARLNSEALISNSRHHVISMVLSAIGAALVVGLANFFNHS